MQCDTVQILNCLKDNNTAHVLFQPSQPSEHEDSGTKSKNTQKNVLLPIGGRLGNILVIACLNTNQHDVPFPSLSKVKQNS